MVRKNVTFFLDVPKYGSGDSSMSREAAAAPLPMYLNMQGCDYSIQKMSLRDDNYYADGSSCDPPGELNTYESEYDSYPYEIASIPVQSRHAHRYRRPQFYPSGYSQSASGVPCGEAEFGSLRTQYSHHNSAKLSHGTNRVASFSDSVSSSPRSGGHPNYGTHFIEPSYRSNHGQSNRRLPSSPHPCRQTQEYYYNSNQFYDSVNYQRELLNELILLKREIQDKDADGSCSGKFGYFIKTAFCQVENLAARRRKNLHEAIGDVARSKKMLEEELRQQLLDIKKQRLEMEERFQREIDKQMSEKVAREAQLESMLLDEMEECVKLEMQTSGLDLIEESRMRMLSPTANKSSDSGSSPPAANATAVQTARVVNTEIDRNNIQQTDRHPVFAKEEGHVANRDSKPGIQNDEDEPKSHRQESDSQKESMGLAASSPGVLKGVGVSEAINSATQKVAMVDVSKALARGIDQSSRTLKQSRLISFSLCHRGTLGLEVEQRQDASLSAAVARVVPNSQADVAGVKKGDLLCHADTEKEYSYHEFLKLAKSGIRPLRFNVRRIESASNEGNDATTSTGVIKKKEVVESLPEAQRARELVVGTFPEVAADKDLLNREDNKHLTKPTDHSGRFIVGEKLKGTEVAKTANERAIGQINTRNKATRKPVITNVAMPEARRDTGLKPSLLVFTNDSQIAKEEPKKHEVNKENAGHKPCQTSHLSALPSSKLPFSIANLNSPENSSKKKSDSIFNIFSPTHSYSPNTSPTKAVSVTSKKFTQSQRYRPVSSQIPRIELGAVLTVSVNDKKTRVKKANDLKVTPVVAKRGVIDVE
ncbi:hypothetical protein ACHAW6_005622 [Cyclotella cf. meneghiniana]